MKGMGKMFQTMAKGMMDMMGEEGEESDEGEEGDEGEKGAKKSKGKFPKMDFMKNLPNPEELKEHLSGIFDGKIGKLATEIAEETSHDFAQEFGDLDEEFSNQKGNSPSGQDVFKNYRQTRYFTN